MLVLLGQLGSCLIRERIVYLLYSLTVAPRIKFHGWEGMCLVLYKLARKRTHVEAKSIFGISTGAISEVFNCSLDIIYNVADPLLQKIQWDAILHKLDDFASSTENAGMPVPNVIGFLDGTLRITARPQRGQKWLYSYKDHSHGVKFQGVITPDGMLRMMFGPFYGRRHDGALLNASQLIEDMEAIEEKLRVNDDLEGHYRLLGDSAYRLSRFLLRPFKGAVLSRAENRVNYEFARCRISIEWGFGVVATLWRSMALKAEQQMLVIPCARHWIVSVFLTNCYVCLYGKDSSNTASLFDLDPPTLEEYVSGRG